MIPYIPDPQSMIPTPYGSHEAVVVRSIAHEMEGKKLECSTYFEPRITEKLPRVGVQRRVLY